MKQSLSYVCLFAAFAVLGLQIAAARDTAKDPFLGNWVLDPVKSDFSPDPTPDRRTMEFDARDGGIYNATRTVAGFGNTDVVDYTAKFDGKDYPISGSVLDTVSLKRIDADTIERTGKTRGQVTETCHMTVSPDGKMLTMKIQGSAYGRKYQSTQVYRRQ